MSVTEQLQRSCGALLKGSEAGKKRRWLITPCGLTPEFTSALTGPDSHKQLGDFISQDSVRNALLGSL